MCWLKLTYNLKYELDYVFNNDVFMIKKGFKISTNKY